VSPEELSSVIAAGSVCGESDVTITEEWKLVAVLVRVFSNVGRGDVIAGEAFVIPPPPSCLVAR
jgi:hypothetical protein